MAKDDPQVARAVEILKSHGIAVTIGGCGCCESPWVRMTYSGENIIFDGIGEEISDRGSVYIDMHESKDVSDA